MALSNLQICFLHKSDLAEGRSSNSQIKFIILPSRVSVMVHCSIDCLLRTVRKRNRSDGVRNYANRSFSGRGPLTVQTRDRAIHTVVCLTRRRADNSTSRQIRTEHTDRDNQYEAKNTTHSHSLVHRCISKPISRLHLKIGLVVYLTL